LATIYQSIRRNTPQSNFQQNRYENISCNSTRCSYPFASRLTFVCQLSFTFTDVFNLLKPSGNFTYHQV
jgi:hypothetical protein